MRVWNVSIVSAIAAILVISSGARAESYLPPAGGWSYGYEADAGQGIPGSGGAGAFDALDGTFGHDNNSDTFDGTEIGTPPPGGVSLSPEGYLRLQDTGDPRAHAFPDPSSRKIYLAHKIDADGATPTILNSGVTLHFRMRLATGGLLDQRHLSGGVAITDWPAGGDGYHIHDNGKGNIVIRQASGGAIGFALALPTDHAEITAPGLMTNHLNGMVPSADVDAGDAGTPNLLPLDPTQWHEFWVTIEAGGTGTHLVTIYMDGSADPAAELNVTAGTGDDVGASYIALGLGSTGQSGAFDVDFIRFAPGVLAPEAAPIPAPMASGWGLAAMALAFLAIGSLLLRRRGLAGARA